MSEPISVTIFDMEKMIPVCIDLSLCHSITYIDNYKELISSGDLIGCWGPQGTEMISPNLDGFEGFYTDDFDVIIKIIQLLIDKNQLDMQRMWESDWLGDIRIAANKKLKWRFFLEMN